MLLQIEGGVTAPRGFRAGGHGGYALLTCDLPAVCSGVYAKNKNLSAPAKWTSFLTEQYETAQALLLCGTKGGICVGDAGYDDVVRLMHLAAASLGIAPEKVLFAAAGEAGVRFPMDEAEEAVLALSRALSSAPGAGGIAAESLSADGNREEIAVEFDIGEKKVRLGGICRGGEALAVLTTDASISKEMLDRALRADAENTFFMAMPDGSRAGDCMLIAASGMAGNKRICEEDGAYSTFCAALRHVTSHLARRMAKGEHLLEIVVQNATDKQAAAQLARAAAGCMPVRAAAGKKKADWASLLYALSLTEVSFDASLIDISLRSTAGSAQLLRNGLRASDGEDTAPLFATGSVSYVVDVKNGNESAVAYAGFAEEERRNSDDFSD